MEVITVGDQNAEEKSVEVKVMGSAMRDDPETIRQFAEFERHYGELFDKGYQRRKEIERKADKKYRDFRITY